MTRTPRLGSRRWWGQPAHERFTHDRPTTPRSSCRCGSHRPRYRRCQSSNGGALHQQVHPGRFRRRTLTDIQWSSSSVNEVHFTFLVRDTAADGDHAEARVQTINPDWTNHVLPLALRDRLWRPDQIRDVREYLFGDLGGPHSGLPQGRRSARHLRPVSVGLSALSIAVLLLEPSAVAISRPGLVNRPRRRRCRPVRRTVPG